MLRRPSVTIPFLVLTLAACAGAAGLLRWPAVAAAAPRPSPQAVQVDGTQADLTRNFGRTPNPNAGQCNPRGDTDIRACLVPGSDVMADPQKRVAPGVDCFWRRDDTKRFEDIAGNGPAGNGTAIPFRFVVFNKCSAPVEVQFTLQAPGPSPLEFTNCTGTVFTQVIAAGGAPIVRTCVSLPYRAGTQTFTRSFSIGGRAPGAGPFVLHDPEVVIEEGRAP